jgi:hypothetical protein
VDDFDDEDGDGNVNWSGWEWYVKWKQRSHIHCTWVPSSEIELQLMGKQRIKRFLNRVRDGLAGVRGQDMDGQYFNPDFIEAERVVAARPNTSNKESESNGVSKSESKSKKGMPRGASDGNDKSRLEAMETMEKNMAAGDLEFSDDTEYLVKWRGLPYDNCTWELPSVVRCDGEIRRHEVRDVHPSALELEVCRSVTLSSQVRPPSYEKYDEAHPVPPFKEGRTLRPYQLEGLNWMAFNWHNGRNCLLADEMGLGKTVQSVSVLRYLWQQRGIRGPFLVVGPLSTTPHWQREFEAWTDMNVVIYHGSAEARKAIREHEFYYKDAKGGRLTGVHRFHVIITTYEIVLQDAEVLQDIYWRAMIVDEAHRLKNPKSRLTEELSGFQRDFCALLTGTPIQNNLLELFTLLNFLHEEEFSDQEEFNERYSLLSLFYCLKLFVFLMLCFRCALCYLRSFINFLIMHAL